MINKKLTFNIKYKDLPLFSTIVFKINAKLKKIKNNSDNKEGNEGKEINHQENFKENKKKLKFRSTKTIAWVIFRIWDHNKRLKTGKIKF